MLNKHMNANMNHYFEAINVPMDNSKHLQLTNSQGRYKIKKNQIKQP